MNGEMEQEDGKEGRFESLEAVDPLSFLPVFSWNFL
jgi:hypothetical protein